MQTSVFRGWSILALFVFATGFSASERAIAQLNSIDQFGWLAEFYGPGRIGTVDAMIAMDGELVLATTEDGFGHQLARWDGQNWRGFGYTHPEQGSIPNGPVHAMVSFQGDLVIAGSFSQIDDLAFNGIARWTGETWSSIDPSGADGLSSSIRTLQVYQGELFAGGRFIQVDGTPVNDLVRWNGSQWLPVGSVSGLSAGFPTTSIDSMVVHQGALYVGGNFTHVGGIPANNIARWQDGVWSGLPSNNSADDQGIAQPVTAMHVWGDNLAIASRSPAVLWQWNGEQIVELPQPAPAEPLSPIVISHLTEVDGNLVAVGGFRPRPNILLPTVAAARWTGDTWVPLSGDVTTEPSAAGNNQPGTSLAWFEGQLVVGGHFRQVANHWVNGLGTWNGTTWGPLESTGSGISGWANTSTQWNDSLVVAGQFEWAGSQRVNHIGRWDGQQWQALTDQNGDPGVGLDEPGIDPEIHGLYVIGNSLFVVGRFDRAGVSVTRGLARHDGQRWWPVSVPVSDQSFAEITASYLWQGELIISVALNDEFGNESGSSILAFNGQSWRVIGTLDPLEGFSGGTVRHMISHAGDLFVAGTFALINGQPIIDIARFDGQNWMPMPATPFGTSSQLGPMAVWNDRLVVASGTSSIGAAIWDGQEWSLLGDELSPPLYSASGITRLQVVGPHLYARGTLSSWQTFPTETAARWDGEEWALLPGNTGVIGAYEGLPLFSDEFATQLDGKPAWGLARFRAQNSTISLLEIDAIDSWGSQETVSVTYEIEGIASAPGHGKLTVSSNLGETCTTFDMEPFGDRSIRMQCDLTFTEPGPRSIRGGFSASPSHMDSISIPQNTYSRWPVDIEILGISPAGSQGIGQPVQVSVAVSSSSQFTPGGEVEVHLQGNKETTTCRVSAPVGSCMLLANEIGPHWLGARYLGDSFHLPQWADEMSYSIVPSSLRFEPNKIDFGTLAAGGMFAEQALVVTNAAAGAITISQINTSSSNISFGESSSCPATPFSLAAGSSCTLRVRYQASTVGEISAFLEFQSDSTDGPHLLTIEAFGVDDLFSDRFQQVESPGFGAGHQTQPNQ
ncbi:MAG: choice-of-anchor D domain-containing protein [Wenzhouxiangella sp.]